MHQQAPMLTSMTTLPPVWNTIYRRATHVTQAMARNPETTIVCFALMFQLLFTRLSVTWSGTVAKEIPTPTPNRIFPSDSPVIEYADGNLQAAQAQFQQSGVDVSVAMYYAHWDGTSLEVAKEFDQLAREMIGKVVFVAVNCWWPFGTCHTTIQTPYYPVLIAHHGQQEGIQYKGILTREEIRRFIVKVASPFVYVYDKDGLDRLQALHDSLVVAHFNFSEYPEEDPPGFASFHRAALLSLEKDPIDHIQFAVIANPTLANTVSLMQSKSLVLLRKLYEPALYPAERKFKARYIMHWVFDNREQLVQWLVPSGVKSLIMSKQLTAKPAVILFTNHVYNNSFLNDLHLLRILALDYYNCNSSARIEHEIQRIEQHRRRLADDIAARTRNTEQCCQTFATTTKVLHIPDVPTGRQNICEVCEQFTQPMKAQLDTYDLLSHSCHSTVANAPFNLAMSPNSCLYMENFYSPYSHFELCCKIEPLCSSGQSVCNSRSTVERSKLFKTVDSFVLDSSTSFCNDCTGDQCGSSKIVNGYSYRNINSYKNCTHCETFAGLGCRTNKSVNFFAMRLDLYQDFAKRLGIYSNVADGSYPKTGLALVDIKNEIQHILPIEDSLEMADVQDLLINFTRANLSRHLRSTAAAASLEDDVEDDNILVVKNNTVSTIKEVSSATFESAVIHSKKNVLLFYYAPWCGFCAQLNHIYHALSRFLGDMPNLTIARINGDLNDLPWEFTVPEYPTVLLYPAQRKDNSIRYPENLPYNLPNLLWFVLENMQ